MDHASGRMRTRPVHCILVKDTNALWVTTARGFGLAFVAFVAGAVTVEGSAWVALLSVLALVAALATVGSWLGGVRGWPYPFAKKPEPLSPAMEEAVMRLSRQSFFERPRPSEPLRRPGRR